MDARVLIAAAALALAGTGCLHAPIRLTAADELNTAAGNFRLESDPDDCKGAAMVRQAVIAAAPKLARWGAIKRDVVVRVLPTHDQLERAVERSGYEWLRAWARYGDVHVQSPTSWFPNELPSQSQVDELLLHELTHCIMYQEASTHAEWQRKGIPVWFREGMASVTADQGYRRGSLPQLEQIFDGRELDPLHQAEKLVQSQNELVYSAAHHAFAFLVRRYEDEGVKRLLETMFVGGKFDEAFKKAIGIEREAFEREFRNYVRMEGWRRNHAS